MSSDNQRHYGQAVAARRYSSDYSDDKRRRHDDDQEQRYYGGRRWSGDGPRGGDDERGGGGSSRGRGRPSRPRERRRGDDDDRRHNTRRDDGRGDRGRDYSGQSRGEQCDKWVDDHRLPSGYSPPRHYGPSVSGDPYCDSDVHGRGRGRGRDRFSSADSGDCSQGRQGARPRSASGDYDYDYDARDRGRKRSRSLGLDPRSRSPARDREGGRSRSRSSGYRSSPSGPADEAGRGGGGGGGGRKRRREEATCFSPMSVDGDESKKRNRDVDSGRNRSRDGNIESRQDQLTRSEAYELLSDHDYIAIVCGKAVQGEATRTVLAALLDAMGMEIIVQNQDSCAKGNNDHPLGATHTSMTVRPMKKKAVQTPGTVRDFALLQISMSTTADTSFAAAGEQKQGVVPSKDAGNECTVVDEVLAAFRLAAHHAILYMDQTFGSEGKSSKLADKKQKTADFARRALMTCFVSLRGLLLRLSEQVDSEKGNGGGQSSFVRAVFGEGVEGKGDAAGPLSVVEGVLLDIVPLLTQFVRPPLGEKHAISLFRNLLSLDETARRKKRSSKAHKKRKLSHDSTGADIATEDRVYTVILRDGLMELFVRQLCQQEGESGEKKLRRELLNVTISGASSENDVGAVASLQPEMTKLCQNVSATVERHRKKQISAIERKQRLAEAQNGPSWDHEYHQLGMKRRIVPQQNHADYSDSQEDLRLLRVDGCIFLSKVAAQILAQRVPKAAATSANSNHGSDGSKASERRATTDTNSERKATTTAPCLSGQDVEEGEISEGESRPHEGAALSSQSTASLNNASYEQEICAGDRVQMQRERICRLAHFLFHTFIEHYIRADLEGCRETFRLRREDIPSAALACYLLAGKMEDCPVKSKTLLSMVKNISLPPPPFARVQKSCMKLRELSKESSDSSLLAKKLTLDWGRPTPDGMKKYELKLLSILGFDFAFAKSCIHPTTFLPELCKALSLDAKAAAHVENVMNDSCYTHSSLCLLGEPKLVATAMYYLSCTKTSRDLHDNWEVALDEDVALTTRVANYAWEVRSFVKVREEQWAAFRSLKSRFDASRKAIAQSQSSRHVPDLVTPGSSHSDSDMAKSSVDTATELEVEASSFECKSLPRPLSSLVESINNYLAEMETAGLDGEGFVSSSIDNSAPSAPSSTNEEVSPMNAMVAPEEDRTNTTGTVPGNDSAREPSILKESSKRSMKVESRPEPEKISEVASKKAKFSPKNGVSAPMRQHDDSPAAHCNDGTDGYIKEAAAKSPLVLKDMTIDKEDGVEVVSKNFPTPPSLSDQYVDSQCDVNVSSANDLGTRVETVQLDEISERDGGMPASKRIGANDRDYVTVDRMPRLGDSKTSYDGVTPNKRESDVGNDEHAATPVKSANANAPSENVAKSSLLRTTASATTAENNTRSDFESSVRSTSNSTPGNKQSILATAVDPAANAASDNALTMAASDVAAPSRPTPLPNQIRRQSSTPEDFAEEAAQAAARSAIKAVLNSPQGNPSGKAIVAVDMNAIGSPDVAAGTPPGIPNIETTTPIITSEEAASKGSHLDQTGERTASSKESSSSLAKSATNVISVSNMLKMSVSRKRTSDEKKETTVEELASSAPRRRMLKMPVSRATCAGSPSSGSTPVGEEGVNTKRAKRKLLSASDSISNATASPSSRNASFQNKRQKLNDGKRPFKVAIGGTFGTMLNHLRPGMVRPALRGNARESSADPASRRKSQDNNKAKRGRDKSESPPARRGQGPKGEKVKSCGISRSSSRKRRKGK